MKTKMQRKQIRDFIKEYTKKVCNDEKLKNLWDISFRTSLPITEKTMSYGKCCSGSPNNTKSIIFHSCIINFTKEKDIVFRHKIILHEIAHLKFKDHKKDFENYLKYLLKKYSYKEFAKKLNEGEMKNETD